MTSVYALQQIHLGLPVFEKIAAHIPTTAFVLGLATLIFVQTCSKLLWLLVSQVNLYIMWQHHDTAAAYKYFCYLMLTYGNIR